MKLVLKKTCSTDLDWYGPYFYRVFHLSKTAGQVTTSLDVNRISHHDSFMIDTMKYFANALFKKDYISGFLCANIILF